MKYNRIRIKFTHHGYSGWVSVSFRRNHGVMSSGFSAIDARLTDNMVMGYPVVNANISFHGAGYEAMFGWLQVISHDIGAGETDFSVDIANQFQEFANPFCYYGYRPRFYDAPRMNNPDIKMWKAYTFLCPLSLSNNKEYRKITPLAGFTWGYTMSRGKPESLIEPVPAGREYWDIIKMNVASYYPHWQFMDMPELDTL